MYVKAYQPTHDSRVMGWTRSDLVWFWGFGTWHLVYVLQLVYNCRTHFVHNAYTFRSISVQFSHRQCLGIAITVSWHCLGVAMGHCHGIAMAFPWHCYGIAMARCIGPRNTQIKNLGSPSELSSSYFGELKACIGSCIKCLKSQNK